MPQAVQLDAPESGDTAATLVAAAQRRGIEPPAPSVAHDIVVVADELVP
jgi:hypothetical protein